MKSSALSTLGRRCQAPHISWLMERALSRPKLISLAAGFTDNETLPVREVRDLLDGLLSSRETGEPALQYGTTAGDRTLRELTARRVRRMDGAPAGRPEYAPDRMVLTSGSQQLLYLTVEALCDPGDLVLVEDPTYFVFLEIIQSRGVGAHGVRLDRDGLDLDHLEQVLGRLKRTGELRRLKLCYLVSYCQNPTGVTTSLEKKAAALRLLKQYERAAGHPIYLLEDTAYRELRFAGQDVKSALAVPGRSDRVILSGTYSKPFATGVRVGFGLLPEPVLTAVLHLKGNHDFGSASLLQHLLRGAITSGQYEQHLRRLRKRYAHKAAVMLRAIQDHFPRTVELWRPTGGLYVWARLPAQVRTGAKSRLFATALKRNVLYVPGALCYADDPARPRPDHEMRLSFGNATVENLRLGVARLGAVLRDAMER